MPFRSGLRHTTHLAERILPRIVNPPTPQAVCPMHYFRPHVTNHIHAAFHLSTSTTLT
jgi:hypothetical protein